MSTKIRKHSFNITNQKQHLELASMCQALSSPIRLNILSILTSEKKTAPELAELFKVGITSINFHMNVLKDAGLVSVVLTPYKKGHIRYFTRLTREVKIDIDVIPEHTLKETYNENIPVSHYIDATPTNEIGFHTKESSFFLSKYDIFNPRRLESNLIWQDSGTVTYAFSNPLQFNKPLSSLSFQLEICSEAPGYDSNWKSDITFWLNGTELFTWTSPGDYGDRPGRFNPPWMQHIRASQYGQLLVISLNKNGLYLNGDYINNMTLNKIDFSSNNALKLKLGNKKTAIHQGGFNLFGEGYGDYSRNIEMTLTFEEERAV